MYLQDITPEILEKLTNYLKWKDYFINANKCDYSTWKKRNSPCTEHKGLYISPFRNYLVYRCSKHKGNCKKLSEKEVFYLKCCQN